MQLEHKPSTNVCRAILLPKVDDKPTLVWLAVEHDDRVDSANATEASVGSSSGLGVPTHNDKISLVIRTADNTILGGRSPQNNYVPLVFNLDHAGKQLDYNIVIMKREDQESGRPNPCLTRLCGDVGSRFRGSIVLLRQYKAAEPTLTCDVTAGDLTPGLVGLWDCGNQLSAIDDFLDPRVKVVGIRVFQNPQRLEEVQVSIRHPAFKSGTLFEATAIVNWPIRMYKHLIGTAAPTRTSTKGDQTEIALEVLGMCVDPASHAFGGDSVSFPFDERPVLLVNAEGRHLTLSDLELSCDALLEMQLRMHNTPLHKRDYFVRSLKETSQKCVERHFPLAPLQAGEGSPTE